jgi:SpoVK/Ycf46/Vps4 family AAA+-type ATPase
MKVEEKAINWHETNQRYLMTAVSEVRAFLEDRIEMMKNVKENQRKFHDFENILKEIACDISPRPALETICKSFNLSHFERMILLLCAGMELDGAFASLCAAAQSDRQISYPTFGLALSLFPDTHWSALAPVSALRRWHLIEIGSRESITKAPLSIDERVLHYLTGVPYVDEKLIGIVEHVKSSYMIAPSHSELAHHISERWLNMEDSLTLPKIQFYGDDTHDIQNIVYAVCENLNLNLLKINARFIPSSPNEIHSLIHLLERESVLTSSVLLLECRNIETTDEARMSIILQFINYLNSALMISSKGNSLKLDRNAMAVYVDKPSTREQRMIWETAFAEHSDNADKKIDSLVSHFNLSASTIQSSVSNAIRIMKATKKEKSDNSNELTDIIWKTCLINTRPKLEALTQRIEPVADWEDLVLPPLKIETLKNIASHVKQRIKVYEDWGFGRKNSRGLGISAMFSGASGTGKTMAAEVLANELRLDLYRIDLSQVVNKYIGETEKNLRRVFDAAEAGGAILLFDEADALFGKRSEVKDSHDRYANIEISYLLQRMESYRGLAILTTNMKNALDPAFLRRIRFIIEFPFPDFTQRSEIWARIIPSETPQESLDIKKLAKLSVSGGIIRNIAMNAAFLAADNREPVRMKHLLHAAKVEYVKLEKPLSSDEIEGWV